MTVKWVILTTDALIYLLLTLTLLLAFYCRYRPTLARSWRQVFATKRAQVSITVLLCFAVIGFLDSIHYQVAVPSNGNTDQVHYQPKVHSALDYLLAPLGVQSERTYSAPFAIYSQAKQTITKANGEVARVPVRLRYAGQHLNHPELRELDLLQLAVKGMVSGVLFWLGLMGVALLLWFYRWQGASSFKDFVIANRRPLICIGTTLLVIFAIAGLLLSLSSHYHVLGTDKIGEDVFYQTIKSIRTGLVIGCVTTMVMLPFALVFGALSGYFGGVVDDVIQYIYTTLSSIPGVLLIAAAILTLDVQMSKHSELFGQHLARADARLLALCLILGVTSWTSLCRLIRAETLKLRELEYVQAAKALGISSWKIIISHLLPNVLHIVLIVIALDFSGLVLAEAVLSYVGVGVDPTSHSWGNMINQARLELAREPAVWWSLVGSFSFMFALVLFANLFADAVRDGFDPRAGTL